MPRRAPCALIAAGSVIVVLAIITSIIAKHVIRTHDARIYRLGDFVQQASNFQSKSNRRFYMALQKRNSIIYKYGSLTQEKSNLAVLSRIVDEVMHEKGLSPVHVAIHLRLGDAIDDHDRSVQDILYNSQRREGECLACTDTSCTSEGYVQPLSHYHRFASMKPLNINVISGSHKKTKDPSKSQSYMQAIQHYLESHGHTVTVSWNRHADIDFAILATAGMLTISGGNFSRLAQAVNTYRMSNDAQSINAGEATIKKWSCQ